MVVKDHVYIFALSVAVSFKNRSMSILKIVLSQHAYLAYEKSRKGMQ